MATPRRIGLHQCILASITSSSIKVLTNQHLYRFFALVLKNLLGHEAGLKTSFEVGGRKSPDVGILDLSALRPVFGHLLIQLDASRLGELGLLHYEALHNPLVIFLVSVDCHKNHLPLILLVDTPCNLPLSSIIF